MLVAPSIRLAVQAMEYYHIVWKLIKLRIRQDVNMFPTTTKDLTSSDWRKLRKRLDKYQDEYGIEDEMTIRKKTLPSGQPSTQELTKVSIWFDHKNAMYAGKGIGLLSLLPYIFYLIWMSLAILTFTKVVS